MGPHDFSADPLFAGAAMYDYSLMPLSPCIDAGSPETMYNDPDGTRNDVGAFAYDQNAVYICGDNSGDSLVNIFDVTYMIEYLYMGGPAPDPIWIADINNDAALNIFDITFLIGFLYLDGPAPNCPQ
jgi:hypothetical protein